MFWDGCCSIFFEFNYARSSFTCARVTSVQSRKQRSLASSCIPFLEQLPNHTITQAVIITKRTRAPKTGEDEILRFAFEASHSILTSENSAFVEEKFQIYYLPKVFPPKHFCERCQNRRLERTWDLCYALGHPKRYGPVKFTTA